jgi:hypothetical protein
MASFHLYLLGAMSQPGYDVFGRYEARCGMDLGESDGPFGLGTLSVMIFSSLNLRNAPNGAPL